MRLCVAQVLRGGVQARVLPARCAELQSDLRAACCLGNAQTRRASFQSIARGLAHATPNHRIHNPAGANGSFLAASPARWAPSGGAAGIGGSGSGSGSGGVVWCERRSRVGDTRIYSIERCCGGGGGGVNSDGISGFGDAQQELAAAAAAAAAPAAAAPCGRPPVLVMTVALDNNSFGLERDKGLISRGPRGVGGFLRMVAGQDYPPCALSLGVLVSDAAFFLDAADAAAAFVRAAGWARATVALKAIDVGVDPLERHAREIIRDNGMGLEGESRKEGEEQRGFAFTPGLPSTPDKHTLFPFPPQNKNTHKTVSFQRRRRGALARLRNAALAHCLRSEEAVLWVDADVTAMPSHTLATLLDSGKDVVTAVTKGWDERVYDLNAFRLVVEPEEQQKKRPSNGACEDPVAAAPEHPRLAGDELLRALFAAAAANASSSGAKGTSSAGAAAGAGADAAPRAGDANSTAAGATSAAPLPPPFVPIDSVGGCTTLVRADVHREGALFAPHFSVGASWGAEGGDGIESEGLCYVARAMGRSCWLATRVVTHHQSYWVKRANATAEGEDEGKEGGGNEAAAAEKKGA